MSERGQKITYEPGAGGSPPSVFRFPVQGEPGVCPVRMPTNDQQAVVLRSRSTVAAALTDARFSLNVDSRYAVTGAAYQSQDGLLRLDPPVITTIRREIAHTFSSKEIEKWKPEITQVAKGLVAKLKYANGPVDLNKAFCEPYVAEAMSITTGISRVDCLELFSLADRTLAIVDTAEDTQSIPHAWAELYVLCERLVDEKREKPDDKILSSIITALDNKGLSRKQVLSACTTIINGFPSPFPVLSVAAIEFMKRPEVVASCTENPALWLPSVDETLRYKANFAFAMPRIATEDVQIGDEVIKAGQVVIPSLAAAAMDPEVAENPTEFDPHQKARRNIVFGAGPHFCPGAALSRQWLEIGVRELFTGLPNLKLAVPEQQLTWLKGTLAMPESVPVYPGLTV